MEEAEAMVAKAAEAMKAVEAMQEETVETTVAVAAGAPPRPNSQNLYRRSRCSGLSEHCILYHSYSQLIHKRSNSRRYRSSR